MKIERKTLISICVAVFLLFLCITYWPVLVGFLVTVAGAATPLVIGAVVAFVVNLLMSFYERMWFPKSKKKWINKSRRLICMILAFLTLATIIAGVIWLILPQLISAVSMLISKTPGAINRLINWLDELEFISQDTIVHLREIDWQSWVGKIFGVLYTGVGNVVNVLLDAVSSVFSGLVTALLAVIFAVYLLLSKNTLLRQFKRLLSHYLPEKIYGGISYGVTVLNRSFSRYITGQCIEALILGSLCLLGMWLLQLPYAHMISALIAVTALIPVAGAYIGGAVGAFLILMDSPVKALIFLVFLVILQQLEGNLIYPKVVGNSIGLPAFWVLAAVTIGGGVMGVLGMLIAVPLTATFWQIIRDDLNKKNQNKEKEEESQA